MKRSIFITAIALLMAVSGFSQDWKVDKSHSSVQFSVSHMVISETIGEFDDFSFDVNAKKDDFSDATVDAIVQVISVNTNDKKRDGHLLSPDFFEANKYQTMSFRSTKLEKVEGSESSYKITGDFTLKEVTKSVTFDAELRGVVNDPWGNTKAGWKVSGKINRMDFGLLYNSVMDSGGLMIGEEVTITMNLELIKQK